MEADLTVNIDNVINVFKEFVADIPLILAAIGANDNRMELETETTLIESGDMMLADKYTSKGLLEPVAVELQIFQI